jgi:chromosome segregation ATPase
MSSYIYTQIGKLAGYQAEVEKVKRGGLVAFHSLSLYSVRRETELKATIHDLEGRVGSSRRQLEDLKAEFDEAVTRHRQGMAGADAEMAKARARVSICEGVIAKLEGDLASVRLQMKAAEGEVARLKGEDEAKTARLMKFEDDIAQAQLKAQKAERKVLQFNRRAHKTNAQLRAADKARDKARMANAKAEQLAMQRDQALLQLTKERDQALMEAIKLREQVEDWKLEAFLKKCEAGHLQETVQRQAATIMNWHTHSTAQDLKISELEARLQEFKAREGKRGEGWAQDKMKGEGGQQGVGTFNPELIKIETLLDDDKVTPAPVPAFSPSVPSGMRKRAREDEVVRIKEEHDMIEEEEEMDTHAPTKRSRGQ